MFTGVVPEGGNFQHSRLVAPCSLSAAATASPQNFFTCSAKAEAKAETFTAPPPPAAETSEESEQESDVELDLLDTVLQPDNDASQEMGDENKEATEEEMDQASELRGKAAKAYSNGDYEGNIRILPA